MSIEDLRRKQSRSYSRFDNQNKERLSIVVGSVRAARELSQLDCNIWDVRFVGELDDSLTVRTGNI